MMVSPTYAIAVILLAALMTFITRAIPFALFGGNKKIPNAVHYLGKVLPPAIIATLIIYCLRNIDFSALPGSLSQMIAIAVVTILHLWKRNTLLSIAGGTVVYMILVQAVFA